MLLFPDIYRCGEEDKDAYLYYMLSVHGQGRTMVFCTSIAALRHISSLLRILDITSWTLHAQMQQRARLKVITTYIHFAWRFIFQLALLGILGSCY